ncbi:MAG: pyrroline-5-carboxylate reductase dimerization domain-containing protein, partial [bacterium]
IVLTHHGIETQQGWTAPLCRLASRLVDATIATSPAVAAGLGCSAPTSWGLQHSNVTILPCGVDTELFRPLPKDAARLLAEQTMIGTGIYLQNTGIGAGDFIQAVASPKGTTAAGLTVLEKSSVQAAIFKTLAAAAARSAELSRA